MTVTAGTRFGPCEILAPLGAGGMGEVCCAHDTRLDRTVTLRRLPSSRTGDPIGHGQFEFLVVFKHAQ
jgi:eukaryotic-like serine/threonine-protein kinase